MNKFILEDISDDVKSKIGQKILDLYNLLDKNKSIEITLISGTKIILKCVKKADNDFEFEILSDDKKHLCEWDKLQLKLKIGKKNDTNPIGKYTINDKIVEPSKKNKEAYSLFFNAFNDKGQRGQVILRDIITVKQSSLTQDERKCDEKISSDNETKPSDNTVNDEASKIDAKALYDSIVNDPALKNAFYKQPNFWNYLVAIVKGTKPRGPGLVSASEIVSDYKLRDIYEKIGEDFNNFVEGKFLRYGLIEPEKLIFQPTTKNGKQIIFNTVDKYTAKVSPKKFDLSLKDEINDIKIIIDSKSENETKNNLFDVRFIKTYPNGDEKEEEAVIEIFDIKGSGYDKEQNKNTK